MKFAEAWLRHKPRAFTNYDNPRGHFDMVVLNMKNMTRWEVPLWVRAKHKFPVTLQKPCDRIEYQLS